MLTPILATDDPHAAARAFVSAGWVLDFETASDSDDPMAIVSLEGASVMLGTALPQFLDDEARPHRGAGVEFHVSVDDVRIAQIHAAHVTAGSAPTELSLRPWGERAFKVTLAGYRFLIASQPTT